MMDGDFIILHSIGFDKVLLISRMRSFQIVANAGSGQQQNVQVNYNNFIILLFKDHGCPDTGLKNGSALLKAAGLRTGSSGPDRLNEDGLCPVNPIKGYTENIGNYAPMGESGHQWDFNWFSHDQQAQERPHYLSDGGVFALIGWLKGPDGVYRTMNGDQYFPNRGIQLYDTYYPTVHYNNDFYDFPYSEITMNSAYGMHLSNMAGFFVFHFRWFFRSESIQVLKNIKCQIKPFEVCNVSR